MRPLPSILACALAAGLLTANAEVRYTVTLLEDPPSPYAYGLFPIDMTDSGLVVGLAASAGGPPYYGTQVMWQYSPRTGYEVLGNYNGWHVSPRSVNERGQIAVWSWLWNEERALRYTPGRGYEDLGTLGGIGPGTEHYASGINDRGQVTGYSERADGSIHAFLYTDGVGMVDLGTLGGRSSEGYDINDAGWVTGWARVEDGTMHTFLYRDDQGMIDLGPGGGVPINNQGVIAGQHPALGPVLYRDGQMIPLPRWGNYLWFGIGGINDSNVVVGGYISEHWQDFAFIATESEGIVDLNNYIAPDSGWVLAAASAINNHGQIVGEGIFQGRRTAFRLDPVPEPAAGALLALGAGLWWLLRCRAGFVEPNRASHPFRNWRTSRWFSSRNSPALLRPVTRLTPRIPPLTAPQVPPVRDTPAHRPMAIFGMSSD